MADRIHVATAAESVLREHAGTLDEAVAHLSHITATKAELWDAVAYLACQVGAYQRISNTDATLALSNIRAVLKDYDDSRVRKDALATTKENQP
jgi:hypothetical protein